MLYQSCKVYYEMKQNLTSYIKSMTQMGAGIPLRAITKNRTTKYECNIKLEEGQVENLAKVLKRNRSIKVLSLDGAGITDAGAIHLAEMLKENKTLVELNLYKNKIRNDGANALSKALVKNKSLEQLYLHYNEITSAEGITKNLKQDEDGRAEK